MKNTVVRQILWISLAIAVGSVAAMAIAQAGAAGVAEVQYAPQPSQMMSIPF